MRANIFKTDPPSRRFQPRIYGVGAWTNHLHFAYDLVAQLRPQLLVELGVDRGESYFAFCQSAAESETGTRTFAIDTWQGDSHAGGYDDTTFAEVAQHNAAHYASFSTLLRTSFESARNQFADESIDVLHLDGWHTEEAVRRDLENWLPKLKPGGLLLLHDVGVRQFGFGVWKVWEEFHAAARAYTFEEGPGLGVWQKPPAQNLPPILEDLLGEPNEQSLALAGYYRERAQEIQDRIAQEWQDGSIRFTPFARQTVVQIFHTNDGQYRPEDSVSTRIGHGEWKEVSLRLPDAAGAAPLRIDFVSALTVVELAEVELLDANKRAFYSAKGREDFDRVSIAGDAERLPSQAGLRLQITGVDPQLILPSIPTSAAGQPLEVRLRLRVQSAAPNLESRGAEHGQS